MSNPNKASHEGRSHNRKLRAQKFYRQIDFENWWEEFKSLRPDGHYVYATSWSLAQARGKNEEERKWIYWMIGPQPKPPCWLSEKSKNTWESPVPWLGDWTAKRAETLWPSSPEKIRAIEQLLEERANALEISRACAEIPLGWLKKFEALGQQLDQYLMGNVFDPNLSLADMEKRAAIYFKFAERAYKLSMDALEVYLRCHGIRPDDVSAMLTTMTVVNNNAVNMGNQCTVIDGKLAHRQLAGTGYQLATNPDDPNALVITPIALAMTEMLVRKALAFKRPLPDEDAMRQIRTMQAEGTLPQDLDFGRQDRRQEKPDPTA